MQQRDIDDHCDAVRCALIMKVYSHLTLLLVPSVWLRPSKKQEEADAAKLLFAVPGGDHLILLNVFNKYILSISPLPANMYGIHSQLC